MQSYKVFQRELFRQFQFDTSSQSCYNVHTLKLVGKKHYVRMVFIMVVNGENKQFDFAWDDFTSADYCTAKCDVYEKCSGNRERCLKKILANILHTLTECEETVMRLRFGFYGGKPLTIAKVSECLGITRERVRQIESKSLRKLRHPSRSRKITTMMGYNNITSIDDFITAVYKS